MTERSFCSTSVAALLLGVLSALCAFADAGKGRGAIVSPVDIGEKIRAEVEADWTRRDRLFTAARTAPKAGAATSPRSEQREDAAAMRESASVTTAQAAAGGCDGVKTGRCGFHTASNEQDPWWQVDLGKRCKLDRVVVYNRTDGGTAPRTRRLQILVSDAAAKGPFTRVYQHDGETFYGVKENKPLVVDFRGKDVTARFVRLAVPGRCSFALDEVEIYAADAPQKNIALRKPADQKSFLPSFYSKRKPLVAAAPPPTPVVEAEFLLEHTQEVVRKARELAARLRPKAGPARLGPLTADLDQIERDVAALEKAGTCPKDRRRECYFKARWTARRIAFCNPLLDFDRLLFLKRLHPGGLFHMVHQFYGFGAKPGGGLFVLTDPFSSHPKLSELLAGSVVESGRLRGQTLAGGSFLSPELSYDAKTILFAYTQCKGRGIEWSPEASFHVFRVNSDGTGLAQLTDGPWNDFDPCCLPGGRIALISERRGGYLRCGGSSPPYHSPTYTLHSMASDGSGLVCLSFHETQEWQPSVDHRGMLVYTRWDYVDRDTNVAHHLWTCYPDGRDPRSFHGNYPRRREDRPWMEMDIRAVPGSPKYVATAAAHHGVAFGSLVLIDPRIGDDGAMSQVTRLTPEVPLPEAEGGEKLVRRYMAYGTPWPLSEDDYLCTYGSLAESHGICWIDRFGNRELIYRDPTVPSLSPIPLTPRPTPPVIPDGTRLSKTTEVSKTSETSSSEVPATIAVANIYDSDFTWPKGTEIAALRIIHVLPKTTPRANSPRIGVASGTNARAVLGTVPVEKDGSVYFEAPVGKPIYFQALDGRGMAVQSMRSATYVHPGEQMVCRGCHEPKYHAPMPRLDVPLALRRAPSKIRPDAQGSNPFSYVRLVQPVLDRQCVACHEQKKALALDGTIEGEFGWSRSYRNLAGKYGFYFHSAKGSIGSGVHGGSRTVAGAFGARASKLLDYLKPAHHGVQLGDDDLHRLVLWLDCNSEFYGAYEDTLAQSRGEIVRPSLE